MERSEDGSGQKAAAIIHQSKLVASLGQVHEVHLGPLPREGLGVTGPYRLGLAGMEDEGAGPLEDAVDAAQAAGDEAGLGEVGVEAADAQAELSVSVADDVQHATVEGGRAAAWTSGAVEKGSLPVPTPGPTTSERRWGKGHPSLHRSGERSGQGAGGVAPRRRRCTGLLWLPATVCEPCACRVSL